MSEAVHPDAHLEAHDAAPAAPPAPRSRRRLIVGQDARDRRRWIVRWILGVGAATLLVNALIGEGGYLAGLRARQDYMAAAADLARIRFENRQLLEQAQRLRDDPAALEDAARRQLGLIRPGETLVIVHDATRPAR